MTVHLVCEGERGSLDERVLDVAVCNRRGATTLGVVIAPAGGDRGLKAVRNYLKTRAPKDVAISVQDRNCAPLADAEATWAATGGTSFVWRRHEIENYLLHPLVVLELFNELRNAAPWAAGLPATEQDVEVLLQALAVPMFESHAANVFRDELVRQLNTVGSLSFGPKKPSPAAGQRVPGQAEWEAALVAESARLCRSCVAAAALPELQQPAIEARYRAILAEIRRPAFLTSGNYLRDLGGKELVAAVAGDLRRRGAPQRFADSLGDELLAVFERVYQPSTLFQPDDFADLAAILSQY